MIHAMLPLMSQSDLFCYAYCVAASFSCSDKDDTPPFLTVKPERLHLASTASQAVVNISTNAVEWSATASPSASGWLTIQKREKDITVSVTENLDENTREGEITIKAGNLTEVVEVVQMGQTPVILVSSNSFTVSADGGMLTLEITSNTRYEMVIPQEAQSWITVLEGVRAAGMVKSESELDIAWNSAMWRERPKSPSNKLTGTFLKSVNHPEGTRGYTGGSANDILDDIRVPVSSATASSFQPGEGIGSLLMVTIPQFIIPIGTTVRQIISPLPSITIFKIRNQ